MSLIGVYPDTHQMSKEQLIDYVIFLEAQLVTIESDLRYRLDYWKKIAKKLLEEKRNE